MATDAGKHVMLSYNHTSKHVVQAVFNGLRAENIPVWFDERDMQDNMYTSMAEAIHNASIVCCFMTQEYEDSPNCKLELECAQNQRKRIIPCMVSDRRAWKPSPGKWLHLITNSIIAIDFSGISEASIRAKTDDLINRIKAQPLDPSAPPTDSFESIRSKYLEENQIKRIINEERSFPIEQSYINLVLVENKAQRDKEKKLEEESHGKKEAILGTFEEIYGIKTSIDTMNMFEKCKDRIRKVLILGRAGIGKSTFCQYVAYRWAKREIWSEYDLVVLIHLRKLTSSRYPPGKEYSPVDLLKKEYFPVNDLSNEDRQCFNERCHKDQVLWILDGYDEFAEHIPDQLTDVFDYVRHTQHHILTSRPYAISLSYDIKMEIVGFTDDNIAEYVRQFFDQISNEMANASVESEKLLRFLTANSSIWGIAHIPVNLELICSLWANTDTSKTTMLTMTRLYDNIAEWLCRRYLAKQNRKHETISKQAVYKLCKTELQFLECLAFKGMENNEILLSPARLEEIENEIEQSLADHPHLLNIGILKSYDHQPTGNRVETNKQHYFVHLSFQEHFAARYLLRTLQCLNNEKALDFINNNKYNHRFSLVFIFASGLLTQPDYKSATQLFWTTIEGEPLDLVGMRHIKLLIECVDENLTLSRDNSSYLERISRWLSICAHQKPFAITGHLSQSLRRTASLINTSFLQETFRKLLETEDINTKINISKLLSENSLTEVTPTLLSALCATLRDADNSVRGYACQALAAIGEKAATSEVIAALVGAVSDKNANVRLLACPALEAISNKAVTIEVIASLMGAIGDRDGDVRRNACKALTAIGEKAETIEVIAALLGAVDDKNKYVRANVCKILGAISDKAARSEVIAALLGAIGDENEMVQFYACEALAAIGEKAATIDVIAALLGAVDNKNIYVRRNTCRALGAIGEKAATSEVIDALLRAVGDENEYVRCYACQALKAIGEKAATSEVIVALVGAVSDENKDVRRNACKAIRAIGEKAATSEMIAALVGAISDENEIVQLYACDALKAIGETAATSEVIAALVSAIGDEDADVRRNACKALGAIGKKAATSEMVAALMAAIGDENKDVRCYACEALAAISAKAVTSEVIAALVSAIGDEDGDVRRNACRALGAIGKKAATSEVISALVGAIVDENIYVRCYACNALKAIGAKAVTSEVIAALLGAVSDENKFVRANACKALASCSAKAATSEVIAALVGAIADENEMVQFYACEALAAIGEKAATTQVIAALVGGVGDDNKYARRNACRALGAIGTKAATSEAIAALVRAIGDEDGDVRGNACKALGAIGEVAAKSEVIAALVDAVGDKNKYVQFYACEALGAFGEKAATNEVITALIGVSVRNADIWKKRSAPILESVMCSYDGMKDLLPDMIFKLSSCVKEGDGVELTSLPPDRLAKIYFVTGNDAWLPLVVYVAMVQGVAMVAIGDTIHIYSSNGVVEIPLSDSVLYGCLVEAFRNQKRQWEHDNGASDGDGDLKNERRDESSLPVVT